MKLLALETANEQCSVALVDAMNTLFFECDERAKAQTQTILPLIELGLQRHATQLSDLSAIAFSRGPGAFSGVRINAAVTQALAWANDLPVVPVSTLQALAQAAYREAQLTEVTAVLDARMKEVYIASFKLDEHQLMQPVDQEKMLNYQDAADYQKYKLVGSGAALVDEQATAFQHIKANALDIAALARVSVQQQCWVAADQALPVYLRDNAWKKISEQGKALN